MIAYFLNLIDFFLTLYALSLGCTELNPLMQSAPVIVAYKVIIVGGLCWWLRSVSDTDDGDIGRMAKLGLNLCTAVYGGLCIYNLYGLWIVSSKL